jgi:hypothetical protein
MPKNKIQQGTIEKQCQHCKLTFKSYRSDSRKFCSRTCFNTGKNKINLSKPRTEEIKNKISESLKGRKVTWITNTNITNSKGTFRLNHKVNEGKKHSKETIEKQSISHRHNRAKWVIDNIQFPNFNPKACQLIEDYGKEHGYNFQHALNGGEYHIKELGYWVDGYDKEKNVVIEYMEKSHLSSKKKEKDLKRKEEIISLLKCKFIEIWE